MTYARFMAMAFSSTISITLAAWTIWAIHSTITCQTIAFQSLQSSAKHRRVFRLGSCPDYAAEMSETKKPPRNGGFTAFLRVCDCSNLGVVLSDTFIFELEYHRIFIKRKFIYQFNSTFQRLPQSFNFSFCGARGGFKI